MPPVESFNHHKILIFLPESVGNVVLKNLTDEGYAAAVVHNVPDLFEALRTGTYGLAVTTRPNIDMVRNIRLIPVVNLEVFFHGTDATVASAAVSKQFDGKAFLVRIKALSIQRPLRVDIHPVGRPPPVAIKQSYRIVFRCWRTAKDFATRHMWASARN